METIILLLLAAAFCFMMGTKPHIMAKLLPKRKPKALPVPQKTLAEVHAEDHAWWLAEALAIIQQKCDHLYHHQAWYTCHMCGYEEPWEYKEGCQCRKAETKALCDEKPTYALIERQSWCSVHGTDFNLYPVSDRKSGPYGPRSSTKGTDGVRRSQELTRGRSMRRIDFN